MGLEAGQATGNGSAGRLQKPLTCQAAQQDPLARPVGQAEPPADQLHVLNVLSGRQRPQAVCGGESLGQRQHLAQYALQAQTK